MYASVDTGMHETPADDWSASSAMLRSLAREHADLLERLTQMPALLPNTSRNLAEMFAFQTRLTRQLFDTQRILLERSARLDAEIASIDAAAASSALDCPTVGHVDDLDLADIDDSNVRQLLASLSATVVRTPADVESMSRVLDEAFAPEELPFQAVLEAFTTALDRCWADAQRVATRRLADAHARAAVLVHFARIEAGAEVETAAQVVAQVVAEVSSPEPEAVQAEAPAPSVAPEAALSARSAASELDALLAQFDDVLEIDARPVWADDVVEPAEPADAVINLGGTARPAGTNFWESPVRRRGTSRRRINPHSTAAALVLAVAALVRLK